MTRVIIDTLQSANQQHQTSLQGTCYEY